MIAATDRAAAGDRAVDVIVIGGGFAGLRMVHRLAVEGYSIQAFEKAPGIGGTWYWNRYPGARCDVESLDYSYSFDPELEQDWSWSEKYARQTEILEYANFVADRLDVRRHYRFSTVVVSTVFDESAEEWIVSTDDGVDYRSRFVVAATGALSESSVPAFPGLESFTGRTFHTGQWPHEEVDFTGRRVAVIGTGSSGIQVVPLVARQAEKLSVLQRTPNYTMPANNRRFTEEEIEQAKQEYPKRRAAANAHPGALPYATHPEPLATVKPTTARQVLDEYWEMGGLAFGVSFPDIRRDENANVIAAAYASERIRKLVKNPEVAERLVPTTYPLGAKRLCTDTGYYETFNRENVDLVDLIANPLQRIEPQGIRLGDGSIIEVDDLICATGFDALTGPLLNLGIIGRDGVRLSDEWGPGPMTHLGLGVHGFPNLFLLAGPGAPTPLTNAFGTIEPQAEWIAGCIARLLPEPGRRFEPGREAQDDWVDHCNQLVEGTLFTKANSWYLGANIPGKPRMFMAYVGGLPEYRRLLEAEAANNYSSFTQRQVTRA